MKKLITILFLMPFLSYGYDYIAYDRENSFPYKMTNSGYLDTSKYTTDINEVREKVIKLAEGKLDQEYENIINQGFDYNDIIIDVTPEARADFSELYQNSGLITYPFIYYDITFQNAAELEACYEAGFQYILGVKQDIQSQKNALTEKTEQELINIILGE